MDTIRKDRGYNRRMQLSDFDYVLPHELIAQAPLAERDASRLLVMDRTTHTFQDKHFFDLPDLLRPTDVLVLNNSKVLPARVIFYWRGRLCEIFYLREVSAAPLQWEVLVRPGKFFGQNDIVKIANEVSMTVLTMNPDGTRVIQLKDPQKRPTEKLLEKYGSTPLPPYIHQKAPRGRYQTVYAKESGSLAAPTAGLHFTESLLGKLQERGVATEYVTLHVGAGTFLPVKTDNIHEHQMHAESFSLSEDVAARLNDYKKQGRRIIAVGTTACRVLESCAEDGVLKGRTGTTALFIFPGYKWQFIDSLITNFHLPKSTLLMLVAGLAGTDFTFKAYHYAIAEKYRFYSFGDAMWIA